MNGNSGATQLASVLKEMIRSGAGALDQDWLDLGTVGADGSLRLDRFLKPFPAGEYFVCERLTLPDPLGVTEATAVGDHGSHSHSVTRPDALRPLAPGDRVLVGWATSVDPVVLDRVVRT